MNSLFALAGVVVLCVLAGWFFRPRYGASRGCTGQALNTAMQEEKDKRAACSHAAHDAPYDATPR